MKSSTSQIVDLVAQLARLDRKGKSEVKKWLDKELWLDKEMEKGQKKPVTYQEGER